MCTVVACLSHYFVFYLLRVDCGWYCLLYYWIIIAKRGRKNSNFTANLQRHRVLCVHTIYHAYCDRIDSFGSHLAIVWLLTLVLFFDGPIFFLLLSFVILFCARLHFVSIFHLFGSHRHFHLVNVFVHLSYCRLSHFRLFNSIIMCLYIILGKIQREPQIYFFSQT